MRPRMRPPNRRMQHSSLLRLVQPLLHLVFHALRYASVEGQLERDGVAQASASSCYLVGVPTGMLLESNTARCSDMRGDLFSPDNADTSFRLKSIWQSNPMASCGGEEMQKNTLVVGIWLHPGNVLRGPESTIKISGLAGAVLDRLIGVSMLDPCAMQGGRLSPDSRKCFIHSRHLAARANSWAGARAACSDWEGDLASIGSAAENSVVEELVRRQSSSYSVAWIGFSDIAVEGTWVWSDGLESSFSNWMMGEPNNGGSWYNRVDEDCATFAERGWNDVDCNAQMEYICSKRVEPQRHLFCSGSDTDVAEWDSRVDGGTLSLTICADAVISSETPYFLTFEVSNPSNAQGSPDISIEASGSHTLPQTPMDAYGPMIDAAGIPGAADPLLILDRCTPCPAGSFWDGLGGCIPCPTDHFSKEIDADQCESCPPGSFSPEGSSSLEDCECRHGYMSDDSPQTTSPELDRGSPGRHCVFCNRSSVLLGSEGTFTDGSGDGEYLDGQHCSWTIIAPHRWKIALEFTFFDMLQGWDYLTVSECFEPSCATSRLLVQLSGPLVPPGSGVTYTQIPDGGIQSATGILLVVFTASSLPPHAQSSPYLQGSRAGFNAAWRTPAPSLHSVALFRMDPSLPCSGSDDTQPRPSPPSTAPGSSYPPRPSRPDPTAVGPDEIMLGAECSTQSLSAGFASGSAALLIRLSLDSPVGLDRSGEIVVSGLGASVVIESEHPRVSVGSGLDDPCIEGGGRRVRKGSKCFQMIERGWPRTWDEAEAQCQGWGGHIASISNSEENDMLFTMLMEANAWAGAWIGNRMRGRGGGFQWVDGSESAFSNWHPSASQQPGNCSMIPPSSDHDLRWHLSFCSDRREYVCSKSMPSPGTVRPQFCSGLGRGRGKWNPELDGGTLTLRLCAGESLEADTEHHIAVNGSNPAEMTVCDSVSVSVASPRFNIAPTHATLVEVPACMPCLGGHFSRWSWWSECERCEDTGASIPRTPHRELMCAACPPGSSSHPGASSVRECSCSAGYHGPGAGECSACPAGSYCSGSAAPAMRCPGNTTSMPASSHRGDCMCGPGYALSASMVSYQPGTSWSAPQNAQSPSHLPQTDAEMAAWHAAHTASATNASEAVWCVPCPADHFCPDRGMVQRCPHPGFSPAGTASQTGCRYCRGFTELVGSSGNVSDGSVMRTHRNPTECAWLIKPPGATKVMLTVENWQSPAGPSGMQLQIDACSDPDCTESEPLTTMSGGISVSQTPIESLSGIMRLVLVSSETGTNGKAGSSGSGGYTPAYSVGSFMARWLSEPSLATKTVRQTNPFSSCRNNSPLLHSNTLIVHLQLRASIPLSSTHASAITISGLSGARMPAMVPVQGGEVSDECVDGGGVRAEGSDKCFMISNEATSWDGADAACRRWGGRLACIEEASEMELLGREIRERQVWSAWIGHFYNRGEGKWTWDAACPSSMSLNDPDVSLAMGDCAAIEGRSSVGGSDMMVLACSARLRGICSKQQPRIEQAETLFCVGSQMGMGAWHPSQANGTLALSLCRGHVIKPYTQYMFAFTITNPSSSQASPDIHISVSGSFTIDATPIDKPARARGVSGIDGAEQPLRIVGDSSSANSVKCDFASASLTRDSDSDTVHADEDLKRERHQPGGNVTLIVCAGALAITIFGVCAYLCCHEGLPSASNFDSMRSVDFEAIRSILRSKPTRIRMEAIGTEMEDFSRQ